MGKKKEAQNNLVEISKAPSIHSNKVHTLKGGKTIKEKKMVNDPGQDLVESPQAHKKFKDLECS